MTQPHLSLPPRDVELMDRFGRVHDVLRLSLTARCNLRCLYCMPELDQTFPPRRDEMTLDEVAFVLEQAVRLGIRRVRLTGGEPLLRRDIVEVVEMIRGVGVEDLSMTTNGMLLERYAAKLARAGLDRVNVSMDSVDAERFRRVTQLGDLDRVWRGVQAAVDAGLEPVKLNVLAIQGFNDDEGERWLEMIQDTPVCVRFLEVMPIGQQEMGGLGESMDVTALRQRWQREYGLVEAPDVHHGNGPAQYWTTPGARGSVGFISPHSMPYCDTCRRLRLTSAGRLYSCLASEQSVHMMEAIRRRDVGAVVAGFQWCVGSKEAGHRWREGTRTAHGMSTLGG